MKKSIILISFILISFVVFSQNFNSIKNRDFANEHRQQNEFLKQIQIKEIEFFRERELKERLLQQKPRQSNTVKANAQDSLALVALYNNTNGANWLHTWDLNQSVSNWYGVTLDENGKITHLILRLNNLSGSIPTEIGNLTNLQELALSDNQLSDTIPASICNLTNLNYLYLDGNQLSGTIPAEIGNLTNLIGLILFDNQLSGTIPASIGYLTNLRGLALFYNQLSGTIPTEIGNLTNLSYIYINNNQFNGTIPVEIGNLANLNYLYLYGNQLSGTIPAEIGNLTNLQELFLYDNQLSGNIPTSIGNLTNLQSLALSENQFNGIIPDEIASLTNLEYILLFDNQFSGLPDMSALTNLLFCYIENNQFDFGDLQTANISAINEYSYTPQDSILRTVAVNNNEVTITAVCDGTGNQYQWYKNNQELSGQTNVSITVSTSENAKYVCKVTNVQFPQLTLWSKSYNTMLPSSIEDLKTQITIYPNPASETINISSVVENFEIYNIKGIEILKGANTKSIDISQLPIGVYLLKYMHHGTQQMQKFIK